MFSYILRQKVTLCVNLLRDSGLKLSTAESCTGGMVATLITSVEGASAVFDRSFVVYSNAAKHEMLGVSEKLLNSYGAVSSQVAIAMSSGIIQHSNADIGIAITGIAGSGGGSAEKPVGLVYFGYITKDQETRALMHIFNGNREEIRQQATEKAIEIIMGYLESEV